MATDRTGFSQLNTSPSVARPVTPNTMTNEMTKSFSNMATQSPTSPSVKRRWRRSGELQNLSAHAESLLKPQSNLKRVPTKTALESEISPKSQRLSRGEHPALDIPARPALTRSTTNRNAENSSSAARPALKRSASVGDIPTSTLATLHPAGPEQKAGAAASTPSDGKAIQTFDPSKFTVIKGSGLDQARNDVTFHRDSAFLKPATQETVDKLISQLNQPNAAKRHPNGFKWVQFVRPDGQLRQYVFPAKNDKGEETYHAAIIRHDLGLAKDDPQLAEIMKDIPARGGYMKMTVNPKDKTPAVGITGGSGGIPSPPLLVKDAIKSFSSTFKFPFPCRIAI